MLRHLGKDRRVLADIERAKHPGQDPERGADSVADEKAPPAHSQRSGYNPVELPQDVEETREHHCQSAVARKQPFDPPEALLGEADLAAEPGDRGAAEGTADPVTDIVADDGAHPGTDEQRGQRYLAAAGERGREDQQRLAWKRHTERLEHDDHEHRRRSIARTNCSNPATRFPMSSMLAFRRSVPCSWNARGLRPSACAYLRPSCHAISIR